MVRMVRSKKEYVCTECQHKHIKWEGTCRNCAAVGTLEEVILIPQKPKPTASAATRSLQRRSKKSEREIARSMQEVDGPDPLYKNIASSTGRIGFITGMRVDAVSANYFIENKNRKIPLWLANAWLLINQKAADAGKHALLHVEPPNIPRDFPLNGVKHKLGTLAIITQSRHEELIRAEKALRVLLNNSVTETGDTISTETMDEVYKILHPNSN